MLQEKDDMKILVNNIKIPIDKAQNDEALIKGTAGFLRVDRHELSDINIIKRSIDARRKDDIRYVYCVECELKDRTAHRITDKRKFCPADERVSYRLPETDRSVNPVIVGAGPAGLFCAYICCLCGSYPVIIERGSDVDARKKDIEDFWSNGTLKPDSNVQFGEGGAGTFSDGKLNTLVHDNEGRCRFVLETFVRFGAPVNILYDAKPHVGTDILCEVIKNMRAYLEEHGAVFMFDTCVTDMIVSAGHIRGVAVSSGAGVREIETDRVVLAIGHSARDTFKMLYDSGINVCAKPFAVGLRVMHPRRFIDVSQYGEHGADLLPSASYKLTESLESGRGVYSFCMCPGGYVVNASSEPGHLAVNGMSYSGRKGNDSNSAIIVTVTPEDFASDHPLAGIEFQRMLEKNAYEAGGGAIPVQRYGDLVRECGMESSYHHISGTHAESFFAKFGPETKGTYKDTDISRILPMHLNRCIIEGMDSFDQKIRGFANPDTWVAGVESRTSSPVRITRDEKGESISVRGLYPCGEGAGYAGGITSAAMDGMYIAEKMLQTGE